MKPSSRADKTSADPPTLGLRSCPADELLLAYIASDVNDAEHAALQTHVESCESCVETLAVMRQRLASAAEMPIAVPAALLERATLVASKSPADLPLLRPPVSRADSRYTIALRALTGLLRWPILIPSGVAVGMLLVVAAHQLLAPPSPSTLTRSVEMPQHGRITAAEADLYDEPDPRSRIVGRLTRGAQVDISSRERDWCRVVAASGVAGWTDCRTLR